MPAPSQGNSLDLHREAAEHAVCERLAREAGTQQAHERLARAELRLLTARVQAVRHHGVDLEEVPSTPPEG